LIVRGFALLLALLAPIAVGADDFPVVTGVSFSYAPPGGLCAFDVDRSAGEKALAREFETALGGSLRPVVILTECGFLTTLRSGVTVDALPARGFAVLLPLHDGEPQQAPVSREDFLSKSVPKIKEELLPRLQSANLDIVGIHAEPEAFYVVFRAGSPGLGIVGVTLVQGYQVGTLALSLGAQPTEESLLAELRAFVQDLIQRNDPEGASRNPYRWLGIDWDRIAPFVPILLAVGFVYWWRARRSARRHRAS
jgi:hypothetical protein